MLVRVMTILGYTENHYSLKMKRYIGYGEDLKMAVGQEKYLVRIRYRQPLQEARLYMKEDGLYIRFTEAQRGITAGQFAAWYDGEEMIGSGVIDKQF